MYIQSRERTGSHGSPSKGPRGGCKATIWIFLFFSFLFIFFSFPPKAKAVVGGLFLIHKLHVCKKFLEGGKRKKINK